jgi:hypothetical protein
MYSFFVEDFYNCSNVLFLCFKSPSKVLITFAGNLTSNPTDFSPCFYLLLAKLYIKKAFLGFSPFIASFCKALSYIFLALASTLFTASMSFPPELET